MARFSDRIGKGIRGAPRDALLGDLAPSDLRGAAYGLRQSLNTAGAFAGPLLAVALMAASAGNFRLVFWVAVIPGLAAVPILYSPAGSSWLAWRRWNSRPSISACAWVYTPAW